MEESFNQSMSIKRVSRKIKKVKRKYINFTILLLIINFISFIIQKYQDFENYNKDKNNDQYKIIFTKNIFLLIEDFSLKIIIIIALKKFKINSIILFSIIYLIIGIILIFYLLFNKFSSLISDDEKINSISLVFFIFNIILYFIEALLLTICFQLMTKEKREKTKEKYGFKNSEDVLRSKNILENSFGWILFNFNQNIHTYYKYKKCNI